MFGLHVPWGILRLEPTYPSSLAQEALPVRVPASLDQPPYAPHVRGQTCTRRNKEIAHVLFADLGVAGSCISSEPAMCLCEDPRILRRKGGLSRGIHWAQGNENDQRKQHAAVVAI